MAGFTFDQKIFQKKFVQADGLKNKAKSTVVQCDSICPISTKNASIYKGYSALELLADTLHNIFGEVLSDKKADKNDLKKMLIQQLEYNDDPVLRSVFIELIESIYFDESNDSKALSAALLRYSPASKQKDFGKFVFEVLLDQETRNKFGSAVRDETNPLDDMINNAYNRMNVLQRLPLKGEYSRLFEKEFRVLFTVMNKDFRAALDNRTDFMDEMEFLLSYYLFVYLSRVFLRLDADLYAKPGKGVKETYPLFKCAKEGVSADRECVTNGWRRVEKKTQKIFNHMIVLNMLNCHKNDSAYLSYSELYDLYESQPEEREKMDEALDYIINQYTVVHAAYSTDILGEYVDFSKLDKPSGMDPVARFREKVIYLYNCISLQIDSKEQRRNVAGYVTKNYGYILKMRFVKPWGQLGQMMMITNEDLLTMISICQRTSVRMIPERGIQISDLFEEFDLRGLCMDGKTKQFVTDYLIQINLIDSKCDSEEAQYVKRIQ